MGKGLGQVQWRAGKIQDHLSQAPVSQAPVSLGLCVGFVRLASYTEEAVSMKCRQHPIKEVVLALLTEELLLKTIRWYGGAQGRMQQNCALWCNLGSKESMQPFRTQAHGCSATVGCMHNIQRCSSVLLIQAVWQGFSKSGRASWSCAHTTVKEVHSRQDGNGTGSIERKSKQTRWQRPAKTRKWQVQLTGAPGATWARLSNTPSVLRRGA